ncbi:uncharacterized protein LOC9653068 [Selaginella moellendorffii]|nr:uncharacterized protein LOC9633728 [Selaginella moellendorffii]XP_002978092.2 uncharacterized protein LOC9653068 [Selaginella moellendorffii]|eukprot:XP_002966651.2 uncharacterized protein LOC9633728 [Selaginella moellendorffii]
MALRACLRRRLWARHAFPVRPMCTAPTDAIEMPGKSEESSAAPAEDGRSPELVFASAMFHSSTNWTLRALVEDFCSLLEGKKLMNKLGLRYLRKSGLRQAILGGKREYPLILEKESKIGRKPVPVPKGVTVKIDGQLVEVTGPLGSLSWTFRDEVRITLENDTLILKRVMETKKSRAMHGLSRQLLSNMVVGVSQGFEKKLIMVGVGYRAVVQGNKLLLNIGFKMPEVVAIPDGITAVVEENTKITVSGRDNVLLGNFAALVRSKRKPEPYKGKGIRYADEKVRRKETKKDKKKK